MTKLASAAVLLVLLSAAQAAAQAADIAITRVSQPPKVDGVLDDDAWKQVPPLPADGWVSYNPVRGDKMPDAYRTEARVAFDDRNIYFAFHCFDNEPDKIRTNVSRRDSAFNDDWIAISLDSAGTGQTAYHLFSNPSGSQMDAINTSASGEQFDADVVWYSVAKTTTDGYVVEIQIPLQTLRFKGGDQVRMGLVFFRKVSRIGVSYAWPEMLPGQWVFDRPAHITFKDLKPRRLMEILPSVTYAVSQDRSDATRWNDSESDAHVGASGKFGITSGVTLDGTINPDFSQVESDQFQISVNKRFPLFFSEKRPFFMEGMGLFNVARGDNMRTAVHTRRIVDPIFGAKLTGTVGKTTFGVLSAADDHPGDIGDRGPEYADRDKLFTIGRATYALRRSDYIGAIVTQTQHAGRSNFVTGADTSIRLSPTQSVSAMFMASQTDDGTGNTTNGNTGQASYSFETRRYNINGQFEHYDRDFQMDTAFYNRTGFTTGYGYGEINFYPHAGTNFWLQRVHPFVLVKAGRDEIQDGHEHFVDGGVGFNFTRQGNLNIEWSRGTEAWKGRQFDVGTLFVFASIQAFRWLSVNGGAGQGPAIYYDDVAPFQGVSLSPFFGLTFQPNQHFSESINANYVAFDRSSTKERIYDVTVINSRTTYQFDKHFLVRFLANYDSSAEQWLTNLLASYEFVPGTVFHAGYGSLYERGIDAGLPPSDDPPVLPDHRYQATNRGLFFKASYLWRF